MPAASVIAYNTTGDESSHQTLLHSPCWHLGMRKAPVHLRRCAVGKPHIHRETVVPKGGGAGSEGRCHWIPRPCTWNKRKWQQRQGGIQETNRKWQPFPANLVSEPVVNLWHTLLGAAQATQQITALWGLWSYMTRRKQEQMLFLHWRIIALRCFISFCCTTSWISYNVTIYPLPLDSLPSTPPHPERS